MDLKRYGNVKVKGGLAMSLLPVHKYIHKCRLGMSLNYKKMPYYVYLITMIKNV